MTDTLAYQIGAVFFLAVLFMAGTLTRGLIPRGIFKNVKLTMFITGALLVGLLVYRGLPDMSGVMSGILDWGPATAQSPPPAEPAKPEKGAVTMRNKPSAPAARVRETAPAPRMAPALQTTPQPVTLHPVVELPPPAPAPLQAAPEPAYSSSDSYSAATRDSGNRVTRAIKSVGHFLHIGHQKYQPPPVAPQPASATP
jgi:hypothetical protein